MAEDRESGKPITRRDLPAVVRRAAELAASEDDADEELPEQEVIRIASELGLAPRHVRQAIYEGVQEEAEPSLLDRQFGTPRIIAGRAVPFDPERVRRALEDYLVTREYLQVIRRQSNTTTLEPAADPVSKVARTFQRNSKHVLASAAMIEVAVRPLEAGWAHVRVRAVFEDKRRSKVANGIVGGAILGLPLAGLTSVGLAGLFSQFMPAEVAMGLGTAGAIGAFGAVVAGYLTSIRNRYRRWRERTQTEAEAILDRLEGGDELRPPPAPWIRKLQMKFGQL